jgi:hypothetical protein
MDTTRCMTTSKWGNRLNEIATYEQSLQLMYGAFGLLVKGCSWSGGSRSDGVVADSSGRQKYHTSVAAVDFPFSCRLRIMG